MIKHYYNGISLHAYCIKNGLHYYTILKRIKNKNLTVSEAINPKLSLRHSLFCSDGTPLIKKVKNMSEYNTCRRRMNRYGISVDDSLNPIDRSKAGTIHFYKGKTLKEACDYDEKRYRRALYRLRKGYSKQQAVNLVKGGLIYA